MVKSSQVQFVVRFISDKSNYEAAYNNLLDAIIVAKDADVNYRPMISDDIFNEQLIVLLTTGSIEVQHGDLKPTKTTVVLLKRDKVTGEESPVYGGTSIITREFETGRTGITVPVARISSDAQVQVKD